MARWLALGMALFVTFLWSTSYILNKWAFAEGIGPITLAGLRYTLAAVTLAGVTLAGVRVARGRLTAAAGAGRGNLTPVDGPPGGSLRAWHYIGLGLSGYLVAQGFQYIGQYYVTPTQAGMVLSVGNTLLVLLVGALFLGELPGVRQWLGSWLASACMTTLGRWGPAAALGSACWSYRAWAMPCS